MSSLCRVSCVSSLRHVSHQDISQKKLCLYERRCHYVIEVSSARIFWDTVFCPDMTYKQTCVLIGTCLKTGFTVTCLRTCLQIQMGHVFKFSLFFVEDDFIAKTRHATAKYNFNSVVFTCLNVSVVPKLLKTVVSSYSLLQAYILYVG